MTTRLYEVWLSRGDGIRCSAKFRLLDDARRYVASHGGDASYAIRFPNGHWDTYKRAVPAMRPPRYPRGTQS